MTGMPAQPLRIGIDIGGTFTDFVVYSPAQHPLFTPSPRQFPESLILPCQTLLEYH
jgi:predicted NBD/HSP70 family sugar kinase